MTRPRFSTRLATMLVLSWIAATVALAPPAGAQDGATITVSDATAAEAPGGAVLEFTVSVTRTGPAESVSVSYATADDSAQAGQDYTATQGELTLPYFEDTATITVPVLDDTAHEADETLQLVLGNAVGATIDDREALGTITDDDPAPTTHQLTVVRAGTGAGSVASTPAGISCGPDCAGEFTHGSIVELFATPSEGSSFTGWSGGSCDGITDPECIFEIVADETTTATFVPVETPAGGHLGIDVGIGGLLDVDLDVWFGANPRLTVDAINDSAPVPGSQNPLLGAKQWGFGTVTSHPDGIDCFGMFDGLWAAPPYLFPDCGQSYTRGTTVTLTATPLKVRATEGFGPIVETEDTSVFVGWSGACAGTGLTCTVTMDQSRNVGARFAPPPALVVEVTDDSRPGSIFTEFAQGTVTSNPSGIACFDNTDMSGPYAEPDCVHGFAPGTSVTLTATPQPIRAVSTVSFEDTSEMSVFAGWGGACAAAGTAPTCTVTMDQATSVTAVFGTPGLHQLAVTVEESSSRTSGAHAQGSVTSHPAGISCSQRDRSDPVLATLPDCTETYPVGTVVTLTATPLPVRKPVILGIYANTDQTSTFLGWGGSCASAGTNPTCTVTMSGAKLASASFGLP